VLLPRIQTLKGILAKIRPEPVRNRSRRSSITSRRGSAREGSGVAHSVRLIVWYKGCEHQTEPVVAELAESCGAELPVLAWERRLVCSKCAGRDIDAVSTGERR
jgi:hypothetical protein